MSEEKWFIEKYKKISLGFAYDEVLFEGKSPFQTVKVIKTKSHGNMLINDDIIMACERDESIYHEMITNVPLFTHPNPESVLIIGGGDGGSARDVLKHKSVKKCVMVEIDKMVVDASKKHLPCTAKDLDHPLLELRFEDGAAYVADKKNQFDVIIVDSSEPIGPSAVLFGDDFYSNAHKALKDDGIIVAQGQSSYYEMETQKRMLKIAHGKFDKVGFYNYSNLTYINGVWSFLLASKKYHPIKDFNEERVKNSGIKFNHYNAEIHKSCFAQPQNIKEELSSLWTL